MKASSAITCRSSSAPAASKRRSSSSCRARMTVAANARGSSRRAAGIHASTSPAARVIASMSAATRRSMPGRRTFTAASRPSSNRTLCACANDAAATGASKLENRLSIGRPSARAVSALAMSALNGGRRSFRCDRSSANGAPKMSARVERNCPSLMATGPSDSSARARRSPGRPRRAAGPASRRRTRARVRAPAGEASSISRGASASARTRVHAAPVSRAKDASPAMIPRSPSPGARRRRRR